MCQVSEAKVVPGVKTARKEIERVPFDATNYEHRKAYVMLAEEGRLHPTLRFIVPPQADTLLYMQKQICIWACKQGMLN